MRITVIGHQLRGSAEADAAAALVATTEACAQGAAVVVLPDFDTSTEALTETLGLAQRIRGACPEAALITARESGTPTDLVLTPLGMTASLSGDECLDAAVLGEILSLAPDALVLRPHSESDLQAEAMIEQALALSESVSGLVIVAETDGAVAGAPGHGGCVIVVSGEVLAEGMGGDELVSAEIDGLPVSAPDPRDPLPPLPPILAQRLALNRGERQDVPYPADLG